MTYNNCLICIRKIKKNKINLNKKYFTKCKCNYNYHKFCIDKWYSITNICPICKNKIYYNRLYYYNDKYNLIFLFKILLLIHMTLIMSYLIFTSISIIINKNNYFYTIIAGTIIYFLIRIYFKYIGIILRERTV